MTLRDLTDLLELSSPGKRILVVEDHVPLLLRLDEFWSEAGHVVTAMAGVDEIQEHVATGWGPDLKASASVDLRTIDAAFLDHFFLSSHYNGATLTREMMLSGVPRILGMSSDAAANAAMIREGAIAAIRKPELARLFGA